MNESVVHLDSLYKSYALAGDHEVPVLKGLTMQVNRGEFVGIMGASGSGKSTLLNILGLLDQPTAGSYRLDGVETSTLNDDELADMRSRQIGFVFQNFNLFSHLTIEQNIEVPMIYAGIPAVRRRERSEELAKRLGLGHRLGHRPNELSGGERQRIAIARALANDPAFILADEPTGNLDEKTGFEVMGIFRELRERGVTQVMVTHNPEYSDRFDRVFYLRDGRQEDSL